MWHLSEEFVGLAFFDDDVSADTKDQIVKATNSSEGDEKPLKRVAVILLDNLRKELYNHFVTSNTCSLFKLDILDDFLQQQPKDLDTNNQRLAGKAVVNSLQ